ncbi:MAG: NAD(P)H-dependent oxidoreductase [Pseudomonadota bacterium]
MNRLLGLSGSLRRGSYNTKLLKEAARLCAPDQFDLADLNLPLFNEDLEAEGLPEAVQTLCDQIAAADALVFSTTEYNKGPSGVMKNALDWISRVRPMRTEGKPAAVLSAAAGMAGGQRAKSHMYLYLIPFKVRLVLDPEVNLGGAGSKFDDAGRLTDPGAEKFLGALMDNLKASI